MLKKGLVLLCALPLLLGSVGISGASADSGVKIGLMGNFRGVLERQGIDLRDGALLALDEFRQREEMKGRSVQLIVGNDKGDPQAAAAEAKRLIEAEKVSAILGPVDSGCALALLPVVSEAKIPMIALSTHPDLTSTLNRFVFRGTISDADLGKIIADYTAIMLGGLAEKKIGLFYEDSPYGKAGIEVVSQRLRRFGIQPAAMESYPSGGIDYRAQMDRFKQAGVGILIVYGTMVDAQVVMQWVITSGLGAKVIASSGWESVDLLPSVPKGLDGVIVAGYTHISPDAIMYLGPPRIVLSPVAEGHYQVVTGDLNAEEFPAWAVFFKAFRAKYGRNPDLMAGRAYSNMLCLLEALERVNFDPARIVEGLEATENFLTIFEHYINYSDENHDGMRYINFSTYEGGKVRMATKNKSLDATKMKEKGIPLQVGNYRGEISLMPPNAAAFFVLHMGFGYPPFMKEMREMGMYGGFRSDYEFHGMKASYSGTISDGKNQIMLVKLNFRSPERAVGTLNLEGTKEALGDKTKVEKRTEEMRNDEAGLSYAGGEWAGYKRKGASLVYAKGVVPLEDLQAALDADF